MQRGLMWSDAKHRTQSEGHGHWEQEGEQRKRMETDRERIKQETDYGAERLLGREREWQTSRNRTDWQRDRQTEIGGDSVSDQKTRNEGTERKTAAKRGGESDTEGGRENERKRDQDSQFDKQKLKLIWIHADKGTSRQKQANGETGW